MIIDFILNEKPVKAKPNESFGDVFDNNCQGKFQDKEWVLNGKLNPQIAKATKIQGNIQPGMKVVCQPKGTSQTAPPSNQFPNQQAGGYQPAPPFGQQPPPPFGQQPPTPFGQQPAPPFGQQGQFGQPNASQQFAPPQPKAQPMPGVVPNFAIKPTPAIIQQKEVKRQGGIDRTGQENIEKLIKGFNVTIKNYGSEVLLEKQTGEFKARFLEENANESEQCKILITPQEVIANPEEQVKLAVGRDQSRSTKVLFLLGYRGVAIRWYSGLQTKFEFWIDE